MGTLFRAIAIIVLATLGAILLGVYLRFGRSALFISSVLLGYFLVHAGVEGVGIAVMSRIMKHRFANSKPARFQLPTRAESNQGGMRKGSGM